MSAMGELGGKIEASSGCGDGEAGADAEIGDLEDLVSDGAVKKEKKAKKADKEKGSCGESDCECKESSNSGDKETCTKTDGALDPITTTTTITMSVPDDEEKNTCPPGCACHTREAMIAAATKGVDPNDFIAYSRAVLSIGPILANGPRRPRVGVTYKELAEKADAEMTAREEANEVPVAPPSVLGSSVSSLVIPPREKDLRPRVFIPKKEVILEGIDEPIVVTMDDEYGRSELPNGGKTSAHDELLPSSVTFKAKTKEATTEPKATVEDGDDDPDFPVRKVNNAEELHLAGENNQLGLQHTALARQALKDKKKQSSFNMTVIGVVIAVLALIAGLVVKNMK